MKITTFIACQYATQDSDGKSTLVGAGIDKVGVSAFPAPLHFYFFAHFQAELNDVPGRKRAFLKLIGDDKELGTREMVIQTTERKPNAQAIAGINFNVGKPGKYRFTLTLEGSSESSSWGIEVVGA